MRKQPYPNNPNPNPNQWPRNTRREGESEGGIGGGGLGGGGLGGGTVRARAVSAARAAAAGWAAARVTATKAVAPAREGVTVAAVNYAKPKSPFSFLGEAVYPLGEGVIELGWPVRLAGVVHHRDASVFEGRGR